ncbi:ricin-type beta-trefoil lectin domain protein [Streptomyces sp. NPDC005385]|uniref:ricin-type beta-trefoil lectin domain protein n=1 Tax=Streptomyces sp. NPDC005385 TaxID=3157039 RepID=UPI0033A0BB0F
MTHVRSVDGQTNTTTHRAAPFPRRRTSAYVQKELKSHESGQCVDVPNNTLINGMNVELFDCRGGSNQLWTQTPARQLTVFEGKCLDVDGGAVADGTPVQIWDRNSTGAQQWTVRLDGSVLNPASDKRLTAAGAALVIRSGIGAATQKWARGAAADPVKGLGSGSCLDVPGGKTDNGTRPALWDCNGGANQTWTSMASNQLRVFPAECLAVSGGAAGDRSAVVISDYDNSASRQWRARADGSIVGVASGTCP